MLFRLLWATLFCLPAAALAQTSPVPRPGVDFVRLCFPSSNQDILNFLLLVAQDEGHFKAQKLDVKIHTLTYRRPKILKSPAVSFLTEPWENSEQGWGGGICDFGTISAVAALGLPADGAQALIPMYASYFSPEFDSALVVDKRSRVQKISDLKGRRVRLGPFPSFLAFRRLLEQNQMTFKDVSIRNTSREAWTMQGFTAGKMDAAVTVVPFSDLILAEGSVRPLARNLVTQYVGPDIPSVLLMVTREMWTLNPTAVHKMNKAVQAALAHVRRDPAVLLKAAQNYLNSGHSKSVTYDLSGLKRLKKDLSRPRILNVQESASAGFVQKTLNEYQASLLTDGYLRQPANVEAWMQAAALIPHATPVQQQQGAANLAPGELGK